MTPDQRAIIRTIAESPDDDLPRLIYCDWLEENGQAERAEFIRLQLEQSKCSQQSKRFVKLQKRIDAYILSHVQVWRDAELPTYPGIGWGAYERGFVQELMIHREAGLNHFVAHQNEFFDVAPIIQVTFWACLHVGCGLPWSNMKMMPTIRTIRLDNHSARTPVHDSIIELIIDRGLLNDARRIEFETSDTEFNHLRYFLNARRWGKLEELWFPSFRRHEEEDLRALPGWQNVPALRVMEWGYTQTIMGHELRGESRPAS